MRRPSTGWALLTVSLALVVACQSSLAAGPPAAKKLILYDNPPGTAFVRAHVTEMEQQPFDGLVLSADYTDAQGHSQALQATDWGPIAIPWRDLKPALADLQATRFHSFTDNFLLFGMSPGTVDWYDDFSAVAHNARMVARLCKRAGLKGIFFDNETYGPHVFSFHTRKYYGSRSFHEYATQVRKRAAEVMNAFQAEDPGLTVLLAWGYTRHRTEDLPNKMYGLKNFFNDGLFAAARGQTRIVDGHENSYTYFVRSQFERAWNHMHHDDLAVCAVPDDYTRHLSAGFGIWVDTYSDELGWHTHDFSKNYRTPDRLRQVVAAALRRSDQYVWLFSGQPRWWPPQKELPAAYVEAVREGHADGERAAP